MMLQRMGLIQAAWGAVAVVSVATAAIVVRQQQQPEARPTQAVIRVANADEVGSRGIRFGGAGGSVVIVEFADFECHFCRDLQATIARFRAIHPEVSFVFRHFPLSRVGLAMPSAAAAECAAAQGRFTAFADTVFRLQPSLSQLNLALVAHRVGVPDTVEFNRCRVSEPTFARIREDVAAARALRLPGTPSLLIGDQLVSRALTYEELEAFVAKSYKGGPK